MSTTTTTTRRAFNIGVMAAMAAMAPTVALASDPSRPLRLIVPTPPGSGSDALARAMAVTWGRITGRSVVVENISGAGTTIGTAQIVRAPKDGLTLGLISSNHTISPWLYKKLPYDAIGDITPIAMLGSIPGMLVVGNGVPVKTVGELVRLSKSAKTPLTEGIVSGTAYHMVSEVFKDQAGIATTTVPYKGTGAVLTDVMAGVVDMGVVSAQAAAPLVEAGKLKGLAVSTSTRTDMALNIPTIVESGYPRFSVDVWLAIAGPAGLNAADVAARRSEIERVLADPEMKKAFQLQGIHAMKMSPGDMAPFFKQELERNRVVVQRVGITVE